VREVRAAAPSPAGAPDERAEGVNFLADGAQNK